MSTKKIGVLMGALAMSSLGVVASANDDAAKGAWERIGEVPAAVLAETPWIRPSTYVSFQTDLEALRAILKEAPREGKGGMPLRMSVPMADGTLALFDVVNSRMMEEGLEAKYPLIRTYVGQGVDDPYSTVHITIDHRSFHAQVVSPGGISLVDPVTMENGTYYAAYNPEEQESKVHSWVCHTEHSVMTTGYAPRGFTPGQTGDRRRDLRLGFAATGEYTVAVSPPGNPNVAAGLAAIVDLTNRCNQFYERDLSTRMVLIANNDVLIFTNAATDPFSDPGSLGTMNQELAGRLSTVIGEANYEAGHVVTNGSEQGLAGDIGTVCRNDRNAIRVSGTFPGAIKGTGASSAAALGADGFMVKLVGHEMGHGFGMWHSMNSCFGNQAGLVNAALEPGSGSTLMSYAGICSAENNLQARMDSMYGYAGYRDAVAYYATQANCGTLVDLGNTPPMADAGPNFAIPTKTPFRLTGAGMDADGDALTYSWENVNYGAPVTWPVTLGATTNDNGTAAAPTASVDGGFPMVRVRLPVTSPTREVNPVLRNGSYPGAVGTPPLATAGEALPQRARNMRWRLVVRDNHAGSGGVATDEMVLNVVDTGAAFAVTSPAAGAVTEGLTPIAWNVAGTNAAPINCAEVRVLVSEDGGVTWPHVIAENVPNTGTASVLMPNINTTNARLRIEGQGNVFFADNPGVFTINFVPPGVVFVADGANSFADTSGNGNSNGAIDPGESDIAISVPIRNVGATTATGVVGTLESLTAGVTVTSATASYPDIAYAQTRTGTAPFRIAVSSDFACGNEIRFRITMASAQATVPFEFSLLTGRLGLPMAYPYAGTRRPIPDNNTTGIQMPITITGVPGNVEDIDFRINGTNCSNTPGSPTVGLVHSLVNQLRLSLINPAGTEIVLWDRQGGPGVNMCNMVLDDGAPTSVTSLRSTDAPYSSTYRPQNPLSGFRGGPANGTWNLKVVDAVAGTGGSVLSYSLVIRGDQRLCAAPEPTCVADMDDGSGTGTPDGGVTIDDLLYYLVIYGDGAPRADVDDGSGMGTPDGGVTIDDLLYFLTRYGDGC
jgi:hypothetical protein